MALKVPHGEAEHVLIDHDRGVVEVDGEPVPYFVHERGPTTEPFGGETMVEIPCFVLARNVTIVGKPKAQR